MYRDRVQETTVTTGTGTLTLAGAVPGFQTFANAVTLGDRVRYAIALGAEWETGDGVLLTSTTLSRENVFSSSNSNALVNLSAGTKLVWIDLPAQAIADIGLTIAFASLRVPQ